MSEVTFASGEVSPCPYCTLKHLSDAEAHAGFDEGLKRAISELRLKLAEASRVDLTKYDEIRKHEHVLEDYLTVLREARKKLEPHRGCSGNVMGDPEVTPAECRFRHEEVKPAEYFHPGSFRTLCPKCPGARCAACPPELSCSTRIVIGCPKEAWDEEAKRCRASTEVHVIHHELKES